MKQKACTFAVVFVLLFLSTGCKRDTITEAEFKENEDNVTSAQLNIEVRLFDALCSGNTNMVKGLLASQIDSKLVELYASGKRAPLNPNARKLYDHALEYRRSSVELEKNSDFPGIGNLTVHSILSDTNR